MKIIIIPTILSSNEYMKCGFSVKTKISNHQSLTVQDIKNQAASKNKCFIPLLTKQNRVGN